MNEELQQEEILIPITKQVNEHAESEIYHNIMQTNFLNKIKNVNINLDLLIKDKKKDPTDFHKFNYLLKDLHSNNEIDICAAITYLEDLYEYKEIFKCINAENLILIKTLMSKKYNIKKEVVKCLKIV